MLSLFASPLPHLSAGPPIFEIDSRTVSVSGRYRYQPRNEKERHGTVEFRIVFAPRAEDSKVRASFGDTDYVARSVTLLLDGKPQKFPVGLLQEFGFCVPDEILLWSEENSADNLLSVNFVSGAERRTFLVRVRDGKVTRPPTEATR